jgi:hypothetical protein
MNPRTLVHDLANAILAKEHFARNGRGVLYAYRGSVYPPDGEMLIRQRVKHLLLDYDYSEADRFSAARLYGKLANICTDLPGDRLSRSAMFKAITGCDRITAEVKYRDSFEFTRFARLQFSANRLPTSSDPSQAYFDRWLIVPFANRFRHTRREIPRRNTGVDLVLTSGAERCIEHATGRTGARAEGLPVHRAQR